MSVKTDSKDKKPAKKRRKKKEGDPAQFRLRGNLKLKYAAAVYAMQAANAKLEAQQAMIRLKVETDPAIQEAMKMLSAEQMLKSEASKAIADLHVVAKKVCEKFEIPLNKFRDYVVDTESGLVTNAPLKGEQEEEK